MRLSPRPQRSGEPAFIAEISASAFGVARVPPLYGRFLVDADEQVGAPSVVVIGYELWQERFSADPAVVGRTVRLDGTPATVVGVMPEGFAFPVAHSAWVPLSLTVAAAAPRQGPWVNVFGRLTDGVTLDQARAELRSIGMRTSAAFPDTHEHIRPQVLPYAKSIMNVSGGETLLVLSSNVFLILLLALIASNVALGTAQK